MNRPALIVNADDFGQSPGINRGVIRAYERGIVRSATLMVRWPAAEEAAAYARDHPEMSVGLHLDLGEWHYTEGDWRARYEVVDSDDADAVEAEVERQLGGFRRLVGRYPTHLDSHQHVHRHEPVRTSLRRAGERLSVPVRHQSRHVRYLGAFYGQDGRGWPVPEAITVDALLTLLESLPHGVTELGCHPGELDGLESTYHAERVTEVETLCDDKVRVSIDRLGIELCSFHDLPGAIPRA
ncbi:MAG: ChbG/HpnK family deacetylase [Actinomycetota bacterium]|nr:ChbG/HpnK family deacetylase [Actinomycetota bacterium]